MTTQARDRAIREELESLYYAVFTIAVGDLSDREAISKFFYRLARILLGKPKAEQVRQDSTWFDRATD